MKDCVFILCAEEQEFLGELVEGGQDNSVFKRDHVFVQLNFKLKSGRLQVETTNVIGSELFRFVAFLYSQHLVHLNVSI